MTTPALASDVLALAAEILHADDFAVQRHDLALGPAGDHTRTDEAPPAMEEILLAEDPYFVVAVAASQSVAHLGQIEPFLTAHLTARMTELSVGDKIWDGYVVLLAGEQSSDLGDTTPVYDLLYDTSYVRRMVLLGVRPTRQSLRKALRPFLSLNRLEVREVVGDVMTDLAEALAAEGIERAQASAAVERFRSRTSHV